MKILLCEHIRCVASFLPVAIAILFSSKAIAARDYPDEATIKRLAYAWYSIGLEHDSQRYAALESSLYFENEQDRTRFRDGCWALDAMGRNYLLGQWNYIPQIKDILVVPKPDGVSIDSEPMAAVFLPLPSATSKPDKYRGSIYTFIRVDGIWRIRFNPHVLTPAEQRASDTSDSVLYKLQIKQYTAKINRWSNATGAELKRLVESERSYAVIEWNAAKYTTSDEERQRLIGWTNATVREMKKRVDRLNSLTPLQIQNQTISDAKKKMADIIAEKKAVDAALNRPYQPGRP